MSKFLGIGGWLLIALLIIISAWILYEFIQFFKAADTDIKAAFIGLFGVTIAAAVSHYFAQKREIASRQFTQKAQAFERFFVIVYDLMKDTKKNKKQTRHKWSVE